MPNANEIIQKLRDHRRLILWAWIAAGALLTFGPMLLDHGVWRLIGPILVFGCILALLLWSNEFVAGHCADLQGIFDQAAQDFRSLTNRTSKLEEFNRHAEVDHQIAEEEWKGRLRQQAGELAAVQAKLAEALLGTEFKKEMASFQGQIQKLRSALDDASTRCQISEARNADLEKRLREVSGLRATELVKLKEAELAVARLAENVENLRAEKEAFQAASARLRQELGLSKIEKDNCELKLARLETSLSLTSTRAQRAETAAERLAADRSGHEEMAMQRREIQKLEADLDVLQRECALLQDRSRILTGEKSALTGRISEMEQQALDSKAAMNDLYRKCQDARAEAPTEAAKHFTWKINYFNEKEVLLNFVNKGLPMCLISASTEPAVSVEVRKPSQVDFEEESFLRFSSQTPMPEEFLARVRFAIFSQEATFRIRPFQSVKIERLQPDLKT